MSPTRAESLLIAELAAEAERYDDVISQIKTIATQFDARLTNDERNLLSIAYKNKTNTLRNSWRIVDTLEKMQASRTAPGTTTRQLTLIRQQRKKIERELANVCKDIVKLLEKQLLPAAKPGEERVFYSKMKGDYYRYLAEFAHEVEREWYADESLNAYKQAYRHAMSTLESVHPTRLGLALNFAVFYHDVRKSPERACHLAKSAFDDAVMSLDSESSDTTMAQTIRDSLQILQLLRDDLVLWSKEIQ
ncbi:14-3-3 domain-containing protein [Lentinula aciculospora]|uniref:14-3-3 domain-containing protein n=1 Tax=Lentinula aciculospora TaxID=153920 RepID=A0A9W9DN56_9AGAR|nr:14-3-3 domain-containing protein [Lentinula aciculospora]